MHCVEKFREWARQEFQQNQGFTKLQLQVHRKKFKSYDRDNNGYLLHSEVATMLHDLYPNAGTSEISRKTVEDLLKVGEVKEKGRLEFNGFIRIMRSSQDRKDYHKIQDEQEELQQLNYSRREVIELRQVFSIFDADNSGSISLEELTTMVSVIVPGVKGEKFEDLKRILNGVDKDGNRTLDFLEFLKLIRRLQDCNWHGFNDYANAMASKRSSSKASIRFASKT